MKADQKTALKPCPFCGGEAHIKTVSHFNNSCSVGFGFVIKCSKCGMKYPENFSIGFQLTDKGEVKLCTDYEGVVEKAKELWNGRAYERETAD